ncbi:MAG: adenylosuccinate lyase [Candidatus Poribacteria bacterium]|nr:MAG: adenylosuccinate lyase [Candidatus Poribacteria bacterium]
MEQDVYTSPLVDRYASPEMAALFSNRFRTVTYRRLWVALAEAERELGLPISDEQVQQLRQQVENIDDRRIAEYERRLRHDIMAHIHAYGDVAPLARPIIHLGATSAFVTDNTDLIQMREGLRLIRRELLNLIAALAAFAERTRRLPTLGFTHFQPAQPTTVGKRACLWLQEFLMDWEDLNYRLDRLAFRGVKGTTGTQASFLQLFEGDHAKVEELDRRVARKMGFERVFPITGQTYPRKLDAQVAAVLAGIAQSAYKFANDLRLLQHLHEIEEPFGVHQVGSSAMPYKRNPVRCERIDALARFVLSLLDSPFQTAAVQWLERSLDDSANRRLVVPEMFLAVDAILTLAISVAQGLVVHEPVIQRHLAEELPFLATEAILMEAVRRGGDRQALHERIRQHAVAASERVKSGGENDLLDRIAADSAFGLDRPALMKLLDPQRFVGRAPEQVEAFLAEQVRPILEAHRELLGPAAEVRV